MNNLDMFKSQKMADLKASNPQVEIIERIERDYIISINGTELDILKLYETLQEIKASSDIIITDLGMGDLLKELDVLESLGSNRWMTGATKGENFDEFYTFIEGLVEDL